MTHHLFVYGSLAPGRPNEHILAPLEGTWQPGSVRGHLQQGGWGAALGFPALVLDAHGPEVSGFLFTSERLEPFWETLDAFEGEEYERLSTEVHLPEGRRLEAYVYVLRER